MKKISIAILFLVPHLLFAQKQTSQFKDGLSLIRNQKYEEAILVLEKSIASQELSNQAASYYLIGIANLELENFSSALNSFETALDISKDPKLDTKIDEQIDKTIQRQNFYESNKDKNRISYYVGVGYDSNLLNLNKDNFVGTDLSSYSALYGLSYSHALIRQFDFQLTPEISIADSYSVNTTFAADSTIQSSDALQLSLLVPAQFMMNIFSDHDSLSPQLGFKTLYLPTDSTKRSLAFNSVFFAIKSVMNFTNYYVFMPQLTYSMDKSSLTYADSADDQTANKVTLDLNNTFLVSEDRHQINLNLSGEQNTAEGDNSSYAKITAALEVRLSMIPTYNLGLSTKYIQTDYTKRTTVRNDRQNSVGLDVAKNFTADQSLSMNLSSSSRTSNSEMNSYQDITLSFIYSDAFSF